MKSKKLTLNFNEKNKEPSLEELKAEASRCLNCPKPNCKANCPISNEIPSFIAAFKNEDYEKAYSILMENTCFPDICSIVCPHEKQCMGHCVRGIKGEPINIPAIERKITELHKDPLEIVASSTHKFAAVGSGPASLAFALKLASKGHKVVIYEKENYIGGVLKWGIPSFRLPKEKLDKYVSKLNKLGVEFVLNHKIDDKHPLDELIKEYEGVFVGVGAPKSNKMKVPGEDLKGVYHTNSFLSKVNLQDGDSRELNECGSSVLVVGGGNAAMDAARVAVRLPQVEKVTIVYRRSENEMPACKAELEEAKVEGVEFKTLTNPVAFIGKDKVEKVECAQMELGEPDESGRRRPVESSKPHLFIEASTVILALGFSNDFELANSTYKLETDKWGAIQVNEENETSIKNVFAGGDATRGASTVVNAMKDGLNAAKAVLKRLGE